MDNKKKKNKINWIIVIIVVIILYAIGSTSLNENKTNKQSSKQQVTIPTSKTDESVNIVVTNQSIKKVDGKYRYFFDIRNKDNKDFIGSVKINLITKQGNVVGSKTFDIRNSLSPNTGKSVYIDKNTGPVTIHGDYGILSFKYHIKINDMSIKDKEGIVTENLGS